MILEGMNILLQNCIFVYYKVYKMGSRNEHRHLITWKYDSSKAHKLALNVAG
jgi:hypothetical protein